MSLSNPKMVNPAQKFIEFKGDKGIFQYYDKTLPEPKNVELVMPFFFIVLDELSTISGYSEKLGTSFYSNEIHSLSEEILKVKTFKVGFSVTGKYADIKNELIANGAKFAKSVYVMLITGKDSFELAHFKLTGAAFGAWLEKKFSVQDFGITVKETIQGKKGAVKFQMPVFERVNISKDMKNLWNTAIEMDKRLQVYLKAYKAGQLEKMEVHEVVENQPEEVIVNEENKSIRDGYKYEDVSDVLDLPF